MICRILRDLFESCTPKLSAGKSGYAGNYTPWYFAIEINFILGVSQFERVRRLGPVVSEESQWGRKAPECTDFSAM